MAGCSAGGYSNTIPETPVALGRRWPLALLVPVRFEAAAGEGKGATDDSIANYRGSAGEGETGGGGPEEEGGRAGLRMSTNEREREKRGTGPSKGVWRQDTPRPPTGFWKAKKAPTGCLCLSGVCLNLCLI